jgi:transcription termination/antitermination protein NusA
MQLSLDKLLDQVSRDKNIDKDILVDTLEQAILSAARRVFGNERQMETRYNEDTGAVELYLIMVVVELAEDAVPGVTCTVQEANNHELEAEIGDEILFQIFYHPDDDAKAVEQDTIYGDLLNLKMYRKTFGRIAAQTAKQVIIKRVRQAERETIYREFKDRVGDVINGIVRRFERGNIIIDIGKTEAVLPQKEQVANESYRPGDRIIAYVKEVNASSKGPQIIFSRRENGLVKKIFAQEVPEIYNSVVVIEALSREPGSRTKIAVSSNERDVDPVGACVGLKGGRVQNIKNLLKGEKIDIVPYDSDPARFVCNAIAPSHVSRVIVDATTHTMELIIPDEQLSLAIGKRGQNVRLASQLTGWKIDIYSESKVLELEEQVMESLASIDGVSEELAATMFKLGWRSIEDVAQANPEELMGIPGLGGVEVATAISTGARVILEQQDLGERVMSEDERLQEVHGVDDDVLATLKAAGYITVEAIFESDPEKIAEATSMEFEQCKIIHYWAGVNLGHGDFENEDDFMIGEDDEDGI